ncbi:MAG: mechanosensitive ion channel family protein [Thermoleophilia bacterium]
MNQERVDRLFDWATTSGVRIVAMILGAVVLYYIIRTLSRRLFRVAGRKMSDSYLVTREQEMRAKTLAGIIRGVFIAVIVVVVSMMTLKEFGYDVGPLLAGAGIAGLAIGFGAQTLVKDLIGGFFVLSEGQFYVGDVIQVGAVKGMVEAIKLRTTLVRDGEGILHIIPNGEMRVVSNLTRGWSRVNLDVSVDYREDMDKVIGILAQVAASVAADSPVSKYLIEGPSVLGVENIAGKAVTIRIIAQTEPFKDPEVARELRKRIATALSAEKIEIGDAAAV